MLMVGSFREALEEALKYSPRKLPSICADAGVSYEQMKKVLQGKSKSTNVDDAVRLAAAMGMSLETLLEKYAGAVLPPRIAVAGRVGAGAVVSLVDDHQKGDGLYHVACPPQIDASGIVAVEVEGDSMVPVYEPGDVLFYSRVTVGVPTEAINRTCICADTEGHVWVKQVKVGTSKGLFNLLSANPMGANMLDVALEWAAPVRLHLPAEFVQRL